MKQIEFDKLTPKQVVQAMVDGLRKKHVLVNMHSFGHVKDGVCYGCAATNAVCELFGVKFGPDVIANADRRADVVHQSFEKLRWFENAIDLLRQGDVYAANQWLDCLGIDSIQNWNDLELPFLKDDFTEGELQVYQQLADDQVDPVCETK